MLQSKIESILFISARPMNIKRLMELCDAGRDEIKEALEAIAARHEGEESGLRLIRNGNDVQMSTSPDNAQDVQEFIKDETTGELTRPSLETLTIVAYRGPILKEELEQIRGVNCSLILRNLMMRGLVEVVGDAGKPGAKYQVTMDFLRFLGVSTTEELPDYDKLRSHENVARVLEMAGGQPEAPVEEAEEQEE